MFIFFFFLALANFHTLPTVKFHADIILRRPIFCAHVSAFRDSVYANSIVREARSAHLPCALRSENLEEESERARLVFFMGNRNIVETLRIMPSLVNAVSRYFVCFINYLNVLFFSFSNNTFISNS